TPARPMLRDGRGHEGRPVSASRFFRDLIVLLAHNAGRALRSFYAEPVSWLALVVTTTVLAYGGGGQSVDPCPAEPAAGRGLRASVRAGGGPCDGRAGPPQRPGGHRKGNGRGRGRPGAPFRRGARLQGQRSAVDLRPLRGAGHVL